MYEYVIFKPIIQPIMVKIASSYGKRYTKKFGHDLPEIIKAEIGREAQRIGLGYFMAVLGIILLYMFISIEMPAFLLLIPIGAIALGAFLVKSTKKYLETMEEKLANW